MRRIEDPDGNGSIWRERVRRGVIALIVLAGTWIVVGVGILLLREPEGGSLPDVRATALVPDSIDLPPRERTPPIAPARDARSAVAERTARWKAEFGIDIVTSDDSASAAAVLGRENGYVVATPPALGDGRDPHWFDALDRFFECYPKPFLARNIQAIHLHGELKLGGRDIGGTMNPPHLLIAVRGQGRGRSRAGVEHTLHHEFAHLLKRTHHFRTSDWLLEGRYPPYSGFDWDRNYFLDLDDDWLAKGFANEYASTNEEEDVAELAAFAFCHPGALKLAAEEYPLLAAKRDFVIRFYRYLDAGIRLDHFAEPPPCETPVPSVLPHEAGPPAPAVECDAAAARNRMQRRWGSGLDGSRKPDRLPTGRIRVGVLDAAGAILDGQLLVAAQTWPAYDLLGSATFDDVHDCPFACLARDGVAELDGIEVGADVVVRVFDGCGRYESSNRLIRGPEEEGATASVAITLKDPVPSFAGTLVDANGRPLADEDVRSWRLFAQGGEAVGASSITDARGRFRLTLPVGWRDESEAEWFVLRTVSYDLRRAPLESKQRFRRPRASASAELGTVAMAELPLLAAGRVVDDRGVPVAGVSITRAEDDHLGKRQPNERWHSDATGSFRLYGRHPGPRFEVTLSREGLADATPSVRTGDLGARLAMERTGSIECELRLPKGVDESYASIWAERSGTRYVSLATSRVQSWTGPSSGRLDSRGRGRIDGLAPGTYEVGFEGGGVRSLVPAIQDVVVEAGKVTRDPRLRFDARDQMPALRLRVVDENGKPVAGARIRPRLPSPRSELVIHQASTDADGYALLPWAKDTVNIGVEHGTRSVVREGVSNDGSIVLPQSLPLDVVVEVEDQAIDSGIIVGALIEAVSGPDTFDRHDKMLPISHGGSWSVQVPAAGQYRLTPFLFRNGGWVSFGGSEELPTVEVTATGSATLRVRLTCEFLAGLEREAEAQSGTR